MGAYVCERIGTANRSIFVICRPIAQRRYPNPVAKGAENPAKMGIIGANYRAASGPVCRGAFIGIRCFTAAPVVRAPRKGGDGPPGSLPLGEGALFQAPYGANSQGCGVWMPLRNPPR